MQRNTSEVQLYRAGIGLLVVSAFLTLVSLWLGWFQSGERIRNSFEMFKTLQSFDFIEFFAKFTPMRYVWFMLPVSIGLGLLLIAIKWIKTGFSILFISSLIPAVTGVVLWRLLGLQSGHLLSIVGVVAVTLSGFTFFTCWLMRKKSAAVDIS